MLEVVIHPPRGSAMLLLGAWTALPLTTHETSAGGLLRSVVQIIVTVFPSWASFGPMIVTLLGATTNVNIHAYYTEKLIFNVTKWLKMKYKRNLLVINYGFAQLSTFMGEIYNSF